MNSKLARAYAKVPRIECKGLCHTTCGMIPLIGKEKALTERVTTTQWTVLGEGRLLYDADRGCCPFLQENRCSIYDERPLMCRVWGAAEGLECPHGCEPEARMTGKRFKKLTEEVARA
jgi:Fe-S-cluster containining protein